jgi:hypothetical protein
LCGEGITHSQHLETALRLYHYYREEAMKSARNLSAENWLEASGAFSCRVVAMSKAKKLSLSDCEPIAKKATAKLLEEYDLRDVRREDLMLGSSIDGDYWVFEFYLPAERPQDGQIISRARVSRDSGECRVDVFLPRKMA